MAIVVFLRGVNVGGHRTFRPTVLVGQLKQLDVVNIGAAGTFVVRKPVSCTRLRDEIARRLPFDAEIMICQGRKIISLVSQKILGRQSRFVFGLYRRQMKAIGYLSELDRIFGVPITTRNWNTIAAIAKALDNRAT